MSNPNHPEMQLIDRHYASGDLDRPIMLALESMGNGGAALHPDDLAALDQFHTGGIEATRDLALHAGIRATDRVLDLGGGLGGAARWLAREYGCEVTVLDLTEAYCRIGQNLTERTGLSEHVRFYHGNALDMPFEAGAFDVVWMQHMSMNIADKEGLYTQINRVLSPGGRLALHEVMAGLVEPIHLPAFWARHAAINFLRRPDSIRSLLATIGLRELSWIDTSDWSLAWFKARVPASPTAPTIPPPLGLHLLLGADFGSMARNQIINLQEQRIRIIQGVFERP